MIDLCKIFSVEEGEEFKLGEKRSFKYRIYNGELNCTYISCENDWSKSHLELNEISGAKVIKLPKKKEFTDDELAIMRSVPKEYKWVARDKIGDILYLYSEKPIKRGNQWQCDDDIYNINIYTHIFQNIKCEDEEPVFIDDYVERGAE